MHAHHGVGQKQIPVWRDAQACDGVIVPWQRHGNLAFAQVPDIHRIFYPTGVDLHMECQLQRAGLRHVHGHACSNGGGV